MVKTSCFVLLSLAAALAFPPTARAGYTLLGSWTLDEVAQRQSLGIASALFGDHAFLEEGDQSVVLQSFLGGYGEDGILGGVALSWNTRRWRPWGVGLALATTSADINAWTVGVSVNRIAWRGDRAALLVQGSVAYQRMYPGDETAIYLTPATFGEVAENEVLFETFQIGHAVVHAVYTVDLGLIRPLAELGWVGTAYRLDADECLAGCWELGGSRRESGSVAKATYGVGASLGLDPAILFAGFNVAGDALAFQANVGWRF